VRTQLRAHVARIAHAQSSAFGVLKLPLDRDQLTLSGLTVAMLHRMRDRHERDVPLLFGARRNDDVAVNRMGLLETALRNSNAGRPVYSGGRI
jgi:hypothetical protein